MTGNLPRYLTACMAAAALFLVPVHVFGSWSEVDETLHEAYGAQTARECRDYYSSLDIPADQVGTVSEAIQRLVKAGYPSGCPWEYLRLVTELAGAGIQLDDLTNKVMEGVAKKVSPERLTAVIVQRVRALKEGRVLTLKMVEEGTQFLDRQMTYTVMADYLLRGVKSEDLMTSVADGNLGRYPALENLIR